MKKSRLPIIVVVVITLIVAGNLLWYKWKVSGQAAEQKAAKFLKDDFLCILTNSWRTMNASGGHAGLPIRPWKEYFIQKEGSVAAFLSVSNEFANRHSRIDYTFFPSDEDKRIWPNESATLAPWWQPETNSEPMMYVETVYGGQVVHLYGFAKATNALVYLHIKLQ